MFGCSNYTFHRAPLPPQYVNWKQSRQLCKKNGSNLVSIENLDELNYLGETALTIEEPEYFIGLKQQAGKWIWISNNSTLNATDGEFPWAFGEPSNLNKNNPQHCAKMYYMASKKSYVYDNIDCRKEVGQKIGYICERTVECKDTKGMS